jgi:hypothetical protein
MPSVRIEDDAFGDLRYETLAQVAGLADADHARGKMARLWRQCTAERIYHLSETEVCAVLGPRGVDALIESRLGEQTDRGIRIRGTRGRIEWLEKLRKNGKKGGRPKKTRTKPSGFQESNPPAPALVPAPVLVLAQEEEETGPAAPAALPLFGDKPDLQPPRPDPVADLWAEQERLRAEVIPGSRALDLTADRRKRIAGLLKSGHTAESLRSCLAAYADEIRNGGDSQWFNGESNWRPDNVARTLGRIGSKPAAHRSTIVVPTSPPRRKFL